jgi:uncharacterized SAM-binding protein YcdF (DUF218 family)
LSAVSGRANGAAVERGVESRSRTADLYAPPPAVDPRFAPAGPPRRSTVHRAYGVIRARARATLVSTIATFALWCVLHALRVLPGLVENPDGAFGVVLGGAALGALGMQRWLIATLTAATLVAALVVFSPLSDTVAERWVRNDVPVPSRLDAIVVLSGGLEADTTISNEALDHLMMGIELARGRTIPLVTTSTSERFPTGILSGQTDQARVVAMVGSGLEWLHADGGKTTRDEAVFAAGTLQRRGVRRIAVVTSPMHTRRACAVFERVGFVVTCVAARLRGPGALPLSSNPDDRFAVFGDWVYEMAAMTKYAALGWLPR